MASSRESGPERRATVRAVAGNTAPGGPDSGVLARMRAGEEAAFAMLFRNHYAGLCAYAAVYTGTPDAAEEVVQDVMFGLWEMRDRLTLTTNLKQYLYGAVRNRAVSEFRRTGSDRRMREALGHLSGEAGSESDPVDAAEDQERAAEIDAAIRDAMASLPPRCRTVSELRWYRGLSYAEIAKRMGIAVKTVEVQVSAALKVFRARVRRPE